MASVLIVDDDRALRKLLRAHLEEESISILEAGSGEEALAAVGRARPDVVLLDVRLPGIDGFEMLRRLDVGAHGLAVILVTSLEEEVDQLVAYRLGAIDFVTKPVSPKLLAAKLKAFAGHLAARPVSGARTVCGPLVIEHDAKRVLVAGTSPRNAYRPSAVTSETIAMSVSMSRVASSATAAIPIDSDTAV